MNIESKIIIKTIGKKGNYSVVIPCGKDTEINITAFFSNKIDEKKIKKIEENDEVEIKGFISFKNDEKYGISTTLIITEIC